MIEKKPFDPDKWKQYPDTRIFMVHDLFNNGIYEGQSFSSVTGILGDPSGERLLLNADWELQIPCSNGFLNWDVFFYWPSEEYPDHVYGGWVERIKNWAYVHE